MTLHAHTPAPVVATIAAAWELLDRHATRARELCDTLGEAWACAEDAVGFREMATVLAMLDRAADDVATELAARYERLPRREQKAASGRRRSTTATGIAR